MSDFACDWTAVSNVNWITVTSGASGNNNGTVSFSIAANTGAERTGTLTIAGTTFTVTQTGTLPDPPTSAIATSGNAQATVTFIAPANNGGAAIDGYTVTSSPAGGVDSNTGSLSLNHVVTGLTNGTPYTFTVTAHNSAGVSAPSAISNSVTPRAPGVDLISTALSSTATTVVTGTPLAITDAVQNQGGSNVTATSIMVKYYLSTDAIITATDKLLGQRTIARAALTSGASSAITTTLTVPTTVLPVGAASGTYYIGAIVDATKVQAETNEANNTRASSGTVTVRRAGIDLVPTAINTTATSVVTGSPLVISDTVKNQGVSNMTATSIVVKYYLSTDATIATTDRLLGQRTIAKAALTAGASSNGSSTFTIPAATPAGTYYLGMIVDATSVQVETNETNNKRASSTTVTVRRAGVDLVPTALGASVGSVARGGNFTVSDTVQNAGTTNVTAANITVKYYLSTDGIITPTDRLIGSRTIPASALTAGASSPYSGSLIVPAATPVRSYTLGMIMDATSAQTETNETNNTRTGGMITVTATPTIPVCTAISPATANVTLGQSSLLLTATCTNSPTLWIWELNTYPGLPRQDCLAGPTCTIFAYQLPSVGTYTVTVRANNANGAGTQVASATITVSAPAGNLNDTGITASQCYQAGSDALVGCSSIGANALDTAQDGMSGRDDDPASNSNTDGKLGFSYTSVLDGCVLDNVTGLMWEVKTNDGGLRDWNKTYTNYSTTYNPDSQYGAATDAIGFVNAVNAQGLCGYNDWRLPSADELQRIVDYGVAYPGPGIDATWFPHTQGSVFWSSSAYASNSESTWGVGFDDGYVPLNFRSGNGYVRLVRAGQSPVTPRYSFSPDGQEVTDNQTHLIWRRCVEGSNWDGATCTGIANMFTHEAALQRAIAQATSTGVAWRLPNVKELASIANRSFINPAIDSAAFPNTPLSLFWSSSPYVGDSGRAWYVDFNVGYVDYYYYLRSNSSYVRLVRAGQ